MLSYALDPLMKTKYSHVIFLVVFQLYSKAQQAKQNAEEAGKLAKLKLLQTRHNGLECDDLVIWSKLLLIFAISFIANGYSAKMGLIVMPMDSFVSPPW